MHQNRLVFSLTVVLLVLITACSSDSPNTDSLAHLRKKAEKSISDDVRKLTHASIDAMSLGFGSMIITTVMTEKEQDSLLMKPFLPYVREELKSCNKEKLMQISSNQAERYRFIGTVLVKNREAITKAVRETAEWAAPFIEVAIDQAQEMSVELDKVRPS